MTADERRAEAWERVRWTWEPADQAIVETGFDLGWAERQDEIDALTALLREAVDAIGEAWQYSLCPRTHQQAQREREAWERKRVLEERVRAALSGEVQGADPLADQ